MRTSPMGIKQGGMAGGRVLRKYYGTEPEHIQGII